MAVKPLKPPKCIPLCDGWVLYVVASDMLNQYRVHVTFELREGHDRLLRSTKVVNMTDDAQALCAADSFATLCGASKTDIHRGFLDLFDNIAHPAPQSRSGVGAGQTATDDGTACPYEATERGLVWLKPTQNGAVPVQLTNFTAAIAADTRIDDGVEGQRTFTLAARLGEHTATFDIASAQFAGMSWVTEHLGAGAIVMPGMTLKDHTRTAIQMLSRTTVQRHVYAHLGWRQIGGRWCYLHAGGAIGQDGAIAGVEVRTTNELARYTLPDPPTGACLQNAIKASLRMLDVALQAITIPLFGAVWRAVLAEGDVSLHLAGPTGAGKTALAALAQQHFGAEMAARQLPVNWQGTANALEAIAFAAKDALLVVDEFTPTDSTTAQALHRTAERLFRAQANHTGRQRMRADTSLRPAKPPRGLLVSTGEDVPKGQSLRARMLIVDVEPGSVDWSQLTECQHNAAAGLYAQALAGFVRWLAPQYGEVRQRLPQERDALRAQALRSSMHRRAGMWRGKCSAGAPRPRVST